MPEIVRRIGGIFVPGDGQHIRFSYAASVQAIQDGVARIDAFVRKGGK